MKIGQFFPFDEKIRLLHVEASSHPGLGSAATLHSPPAVGPEMTQPRTSPGAPVPRHLPSLQPQEAQGRDAGVAWTLGSGDGGQEWGARGLASSPADARPRPRHTAPGSSAAPAGHSAGHGMALMGRTPDRVEPSWTLLQRATPNNMITQFISGPLYHYCSLSRLRVLDTHRERVASVRGWLPGATRTPLGTLHPLLPPGPHLPSSWTPAASEHAEIGRAAGSSRPSVSSGTGTATSFEPSLCERPGDRVGGFTGRASAALVFSALGGLTLSNHGGVPSTEARG